MVKSIVSVVAVLAVCGLALCDIPFDQVQNGDFTYYNDKGFGSCGTQIDASSEMLVAVSHEFFTSANPNLDPLCTGNVCVSVNYNGKNVKVPVKDKCPSCNKGHLDLSQPAFQQLESLEKGHVFGTQWSFVHC